MNNKEIPTAGAKVTRQKWTWLLILQGWTMLWVVIGHAPLPAHDSASQFDLFSMNLAEALTTFAYSFHMPLFIMISGYLFYNTRIASGWTYGKMAYEKFLRLGIPYIIFIALAIFMKVLLPGDINRPVDTTVTGLLMNFIDPFNGALCEMWFVASIIIYFLLYPLYGILLRSRTVAVVSLLFATGLYFIPTSLLPSVFAIDKAVHFFIFFMLGLCVARFKFEQTLVKCNIIAVCIAGYVLSRFIKIEPLGAVFMSFAFWGLAIRVDRSLTSNMFHTFRNYTYQIFLAGIFAQIGIKAVYNRLAPDGSYFVVWLVCILVGIYIPVLIARWAEKYGNKLIKIAFGLK